MITKIHNFEIVLNGYSPTISDYKLTKIQLKVIKWLASIRYKRNIFIFPFEIKLLLKFWLQYRKPEFEGFYSE